MPAITMRLILDELNYSAEGYYNFLINIEGKEYCVSIIEENSDKKERERERDREEIIPKISSV